MKTKNQTEQALLELAMTKAANDDGIIRRRTARSGRGCPQAGVESVRSLAHAREGAGRSSIAASPLQSRAARLAVAPQLPNTYKAHLIQGGSRRLGKHGAHENFVAQPPGRRTSARAAASAFCVSRNRSKPNSAPSIARACACWNRLAIIVSACTVTGFAILDHFVLSAEHSRITNMVRFGMHVPRGALHAGAARRSASTTAGMTSASASSRRCSASARSSWRRPRRPAEVPLVGGRLLLATFFFYLHGGPAAARSTARQPHRVRRAGRRGPARHHALPRRRPTSCSRCSAPTSSASPARTRWNTRTARRFSSIASSPTSRPTMV